MAIRVKQTGIPKITVHACFGVKSSLYGLYASSRYDPELNMDAIRAMKYRNIKNTIGDKTMMIRIAARVNIIASKGSHETLHSMT